MTKGQAILYIFILIVACCSCTIIRVKDSNNVNIETEKYVNPKVKLNDRGIDKDTTEQRF